MNYSIESLINAYNYYHYKYININKADHDKILEYVKLISDQYELKSAFGTIDEFNNICNEIFDYFESKEPEHFAIFMIDITFKRIFITYKEVPRYSYIVKKYSDFINTIRIHDKIEQLILSYYYPKTLKNHAVLEVLKHSKELGNKGTNGYRTQDYVHSKMSEELGEHSVELQIQKGLSYKNPGKDLLHGEAVDLAICCIDSFALEFPDLTADEIMVKFNEYMLVKLQKWKNQK